MTDERQGDALWHAIEALPRGSGIVFRHYSMSDPERRAMARRIRKIANRRHLAFVVAGSRQLARAAEADGWHSRTPLKTPAKMIRTVAVHNAREMVAASKTGADAVFLSPAFPTASHPGEPALGALRFGALAQQAAAPVIALGGMNAARAKALRRFGIYGWAGIGALTPKG